MEFIPSKSPFPSCGTLLIETWMSRVVKSAEAEICGDTIATSSISVLSATSFNSNSDWSIKGKCRKVIKSVLSRTHHAIEITRDEVKDNQIMLNGTPRKSSLTHLLPAPAYILHMVLD